MTEWMKARLFSSSRTHRLAEQLASSSSPARFRLRQKKKHQGLWAKNSHRVETWADGDSLHSPLYFQKPYKLRWTAWTSCFDSLQQEAQHSRSSSFTPGFCTPSALIGSFTPAPSRGRAFKITLFKNPSADTTRAPLNIHSFSETHKPWACDNTLQGARAHTHSHTL